MQGLQHGFDVGIAQAAGEFTVGESPCAALAEEHVALGVQRTACFKGSDILGALIHRLTPFQQNGLRAPDCQRQRAEQTSRAGTHHNGSKGILGPRLH